MIHLAVITVIYSAAAVAAVDPGSRSCSPAAAPAPQGGPDSRNRCSEAPGRKQNEAKNMNAA